MNIGFKDVSPIFWRNVFDDVEPYRETMLSELSKIDAIARKNEKNGPHPAAINYRTMMALYALCNSLNPKLVFEVGTYSGRSAMVMACFAKVHTCDISSINASFGEYDVTFHHGTSTQMFEVMTEKPDMLFLDGRLQKDDLTHLSRLLTKDTVIVVDDFEGVEKGVCNMQILNPPCLMYPPPGTTLAVGLGAVYVKLTRQ